MKRTVIITAIVIVASLIFLLAFNKIASRKNSAELFAEAVRGEFEIAINTTGELIAERTVNINGPEYSQGRDIRMMNIKIQDMVPEGTVVKKGDYIATLDRTELTNTLKDERERLQTLRTNFDMKLLDTAVVLTSLRDAIKNQRYTVDEAAITLRNSKYESPSVIRQAEINLDKQQRILEQRMRSYTRVVAQNKTDIYNQKFWLSRIEKRVSDIEEVLAGFTITAPESGMVVYKREWSGTKRKVGSMVNPIDRVVATIPDLSSLVSKTYVSEIEVSKVKIGQKVNLKVDAFPDKAFTGTISYVANIGEKLPNTTDKVFEVQIRLDEVDPVLRPSMTTGNKIIIKTFKEAVYVPIECVQASADSVTFVYTKSGHRQVVITGESNDKNIIIEKGLNAGTIVYLDNPENPGKFKMVGETLIPEIREQRRILRAEQEKFRKRT